MARAKHKLVTWPKAVLGWALICAGLYAFSVISAALDEAECNARGDWFCDPGDAAVFLGLVYFVLFALGLVPIGLVWILDTFLRRRSAMPRLGSF